MGRAEGSLMHLQTEAIWAGSWELITRASPQVGGLIPYLFPEDLPVKHILMGHFMMRILYLFP